MAFNGSIKVRPSGVSAYSTFGRDDRMHLARDKPVALQTAQSLGKHLLRNPANLALELGVAACPGGEDVNDQRRPLIRDAAEHHPREAMRVHDGRLVGALRHGDFLIASGDTCNGRVTNRQEGMR